MSTVEAEQPERLLTTTEAMQVLGVTWDTIYRYIHTGKLKAHKLGNGDTNKGNKKHWRIKESDLKVFYTGGQNEATEDR